MSVNIYDGSTKKLNKVADKTIVDTALDATSTNALQNKVISASITSLTSSIEELPVVKNSSGAVDVGQDGQALLSKGDGTYCWGSGGGGAYIKVTTTSLKGQSITCSGQMETLSGQFDADGNVTFTVKYIDTYTLTCDRYSVNVEVLAIGAIYKAQIEEHYSTINFTTTSDDVYNLTITVKQGDTKLGTVTFNPDTASYKVYDLGTYSGTVTTASGDVITEEIEVTELDTSYSVAIDSYKIVTFADGTDAEIEKLLKAYYNNQVTWADMGWAVGDTRTISLSQMQAPNPNSSSTWAAQNITIVIVDHDHTPLETPINGHTNACITVQTREVLSSSAGTAGTIYVNGDSSYDMSFTKWSNLYMRTYMNSVVFGAFQDDFKSLIKPTTHYRHTTHNGSASEQVTDTLFLPSYPEIFGTASYSYYVATSPVEGTQFEYYKTSSNRIKYGNNNGASNGNSQYWWQGSASSYYNSSFGYDWCIVNTDGSANFSRGDRARGLAPAFAL